MLTKLDIIIVNCAIFFRLCSRFHINMENSKKPRYSNDNFTTVEGYIVDVTSLTVSKKSPNVKYFNFTLQTSAEHYSRGVVFTPERHQSFVNARDNKTPLQLTCVSKELSKYY